MKENASAELAVLSPHPVGILHGWKLLGLAALLNALLFGAVLALGTPTYETNDDLTMQFLASGFFTGHPSEYLVFTNVIIGWALRGLYTVWRLPNWYFAYLIAVHFASLTAIAFVSLSLGRRRMSALLFLGFFLLVEPRLLLNLQFTTTAFVAGTAGVFLLVDGLSLGRSRAVSKVMAGFIFLSLTVMIRESVVPLLGLVAWPFLLERFGLTGWRRVLAAGAAGVALLLALVGINRWYYQRDPAWAEFFEYNRLRGNIQLTPLAKFIAQAAPEAGWTQNDGRMFANFYFPDPEVYLPASKLHHLYEQLQTMARNEPSPWRFSAADLFLPEMFNEDSANLMKVALLNAAGCLVVAGRNHRRLRYLLALLATYGMCLLVSLYLRHTARLPERVSYNLALFLNAICLYWAAGLTAPNPSAQRQHPIGCFFSTLSRPTRLLVGGFFAIWIALYAPLVLAGARNLGHANSSHRTLKETSRTIFEPVATLLPPGKRPVLVPLPFDSLLEQSLFFNHSKAPPFTIVPYGWPTHSPVYYEILAQNQLRPDPASLLDRPDVFFLMQKRWLEPLEIYYREHKGLEVRFEVVLDTDLVPQYRRYELHIYRAHSSDASGKSAGFSP